jgi:hypothetical protein
MQHEYSRESFRTTPATPSPAFVVNLVLARAVFTCECLHWAPHSQRSEGGEPAYYHAAAR